LSVEPNKHIQSQRITTPPPSVGSSSSCHSFPSSFVLRLTPFDSPAQSVPSQDSQRPPQHLLTALPRSSVNFAPHSNSPKMSDLLGHITQGFEKLVRPSTLIIPLASDPVQRCRRPAPTVPKKPSPVRPSSPPSLSPLIPPPAEQSLSTQTTATTKRTSERRTRSGRGWRRVIGFLRLRM
jgi:hypothetical protein